MKRKSPCIFALMLTIVCVSTRVFAQIDPDELISVDIAAEGFMVAWDAPSLSLAVGLGPDIVYRKGYGNYNALEGYEEYHLVFDAPRVPEENTKYRVGSISKALTSTVLFTIIQQMIDAGMIIDAGGNGIADDVRAVVLDRPVFSPANNAILEQYVNLRDNIPGYSPITVQHLLNHASGLGFFNGTTPNGSKNPNLHDFDLVDGGNMLTTAEKVDFSIAMKTGKPLPITARDVAIFALSFSDAQFPPGTDTNYACSTFGYPALSMVIEELDYWLHGTRRSFEEIATDVFSTIGAYDTLPGRSRYDQRHYPGGVSLFYDEAFYFDADFHNPYLSRVHYWVPGMTAPLVPRNYGSSNREAMLAPGGFISTPVDLLAILSDLYDTGVLMDPQLRDMMIPPADPDYENGWSYEKRDNGPGGFLSRGGSYSGTRAFTFRDTNSDVSFASLINTQGDDNMDYRVNQHHVRLGKIALKGNHGGLVDGYQEVFRAFPFVLPSNLVPATIGKGLTHFAVYGKEQVHFNDRAEMLDGLLSKVRGNIGAGSWIDSLAWGGPNTNAYCELGLDSKVQNVISSGDILLMRAKVFGHAVAGGQFLPPPLGGTVIHGKSIDHYNYDPGYVNFDVNENAIQGELGTPTDSVEVTSVFNPKELQPWSTKKYYDVTVNTATKLILPGGTYFLNSLTFGDNSRLNIKNTRTVQNNGQVAYQPVIIFVKEQFSAGKGFRIIFEEDNADASDVIIISAGSNTIDIESDVVWRATLMAPNAHIDFEGGSSSTVEGAFWGREVTIHADTKIKHRPFGDIHGIYPYLTEGCPVNKGSGSYCSAECPCERFEGDCDNDAQCASGLTCAHQVGDSFGMTPESDVCLDAACAAKTPSTASYCKPDCPCGVGGGDCDSDAECLSGLACADNVGSAFGQPAEHDVCVAVECVSRTLGSASYCSEDCPCGVGGGDCDPENNECLPGLACAENVGSAFGQPANHDICVAAECADLIQGDSSYCSEDCPCGHGGGDCDNDDQCLPGLTCAEDIGPAFNMSSATDVCVPDSCATRVLYSEDYCSADCPCGYGGGDCETDADCMPGLICGTNNGPEFGLPDAYDVCVD